MTKSFIVVTGNRTGATFLCHCLSNHPQVFCHRSETMHQSDTWRVRFPEMPAKQLLDAMLHQERYDASGCKLLYRQLLAKEVWRYVMSEKVSLLFLTRRNLLKQAVSLWIANNKVPGHPLHTVAAVGLLPKIEIPPRDLLKYCKGLTTEEASARKQVKRSKLPVLFLNYEELSNGGRHTNTIPMLAARRICDFLEVTAYPLRTLTHKVHQPGLSGVISNYNEVLEAFRDSPFRR